MYRPNRIGPSSLIDISQNSFDINQSNFDVINGTIGNVQNLLVGMATNVQYTEYASQRFTWEAINAGNASDVRNPCVGIIFSTPDEDLISNGAFHYTFTVTSCINFTAPGGDQAWMLPVPVIGQFITASPAALPVVHSITSFTCLPCSMHTASDGNTKNIHMSMNEDIVVGRFLGNSFNVLPMFFGVSMLNQFNTDRTFTGYIHISVFRYLIDIDTFDPTR